MFRQSTLTESWNPIQDNLMDPAPEWNIQDKDVNITEIEINNRQLTQKEKIMELLTTYDRWPSDKFGFPQYNARINEINKEMAKIKRSDGFHEQICTHYDPIERRYYKRIELIKDG